MSPIAGTDASDVGQLHWEALDQWTWRAVSGHAVIGTVTDEDRWVVRLADGSLAGVHTSLESAQSQLAAWLRWETTALHG